jgi:predicted GNAT superfamily acetyltransferase
MIPEMQTSIAIRQITDGAQMRAVENLQKEVWGIPDLDVVPVTQLVAAQAAGGVLLGAFDDEKLVGFVYGFVGCEAGKMTHHSHMLAVKPAYRNYHLGERLKWTQRDCVLRQGINLMTWTFDPLQSLNAYFNFNKLGVVAERYVADFYGTDAASFLHRNGTDRFWVTWHLDSERVKNRAAKKAAVVEVENVKRLVRFGEDYSPIVAAPEETDERLAIEIPAGINELQEQNPALAVQWRRATREAFTAALSRDFFVSEFYRGTRGAHGYGVYLLDRKQ